MPTLKEAKTSCHALLGLTKSSDEWDSQHRIVWRYLDQEPENPDAEVLKEIQGIIAQLDRPNLLYHWIFGDGDGVWGLEHISPEDRTAVFPPDFTLDDLVVKMRQLPTPKPTLETEQAARKAAENKLWAQDVLLKAAQVSCEKAEEKLVAAEKRIAELEMPMTSAQYEGDDGRVYRVLFFFNGFRVVHRADRCPWYTSRLENLNSDFATFAEAQTALNDHAKGNSWSQVIQ